MKSVVIAHCEAKNNGKMEQFTREIAKFEYPHQAEEFIEKCLPQERRSSFEVIHKDDSPELDIELLIELLQDLHNRLVDNYNNNTPFEQTEEDRLVLNNVIEFLTNSQERK